MPLGTHDNLQKMGKLELISQAKNRWCVEDSTILQAPSVQKAVAIRLRIVALATLFLSNVYILQRQNCLSIELL